MAYNPLPTPAQEILSSNNLKSGRMKAYKIYTLVCVRNSTIPNQRLMLKYNPRGCASIHKLFHLNTGSGMNFILMFNQRATIYYSAALFSFKIISLTFFSVMSNGDQQTFQPGSSIKRKYSRIQLPRDMKKQVQLCTIWLKEKKTYCAHTAATV